MGLGLDFGTTNSSIARVTGTGDVEVVQFPAPIGLTESFRSLLYLERHREGGRTTIKNWSGPEGIERYLHSDEKGRLIQSLKSFLASRSLQSTEIFGRQFRLEALIARILKDIRTVAGKRFGSDLPPVVVGRPIRFVSAESEADDEYAISRLRESLNEAGFSRVSFEFEPVGAAYHYESTLEKDELILIGDFGGGTSDFSLLRVGPSFSSGGSADERVIGNQGLGLAGDAFDAKLIRHLVSPALGAGSSLKSGEKLLPVPNWVYLKLERWHHLSFLKSQETLNMLTSVARQALEPEKIEALLYLVRHDLGYQLHRAIQKVKASLSHNHTATFRFDDGDVAIRAEVTRTEFEAWIAEELYAIEDSLNSLLTKSGIAPGKVDRVFLTGGSSFVPAVRRIFESRFGPDKIRTGDEFTSVARGLALRSLHT
jgi:hypothetical chaperone protein